MHHYIVIRADLPKGVQIAQTIHAAGESVRGSVPPTTHAVALEAATEADLLDLERKLLDLGIPHVAIREPDFPYHNQLMAVGVVPMVRTKTLRKVMARFALIR